MSHLLFVDDYFLFCKANLTEVHRLMETLKVYEDASGKKINMNKSEFYFTRNLSIQAHEDMSRIMGDHHVLGTGTYLGLPFMVGRSIKKVIFMFIEDRIRKRINSWRGRPLSKAGKQVMIKLVLQAIPAYVMSVLFC